MRYPIHSNSLRKLPEVAVRRSPVLAEQSRRTEARRALANEGDVDALNEILDRFKDDPRGLIRFGVGNLAMMAEKNALQTIFDHAPVTLEAIRARMREIRRDLEGPELTALERLLAERAALCWLDLHIADLLKISDSDRGSLGKTLKIGDARDKRCTRAHDRYMKALKTLAQVRKLKLPDVRVNAVVLGDVGAIPTRPIEDRVIDSPPNSG